MCALDLAIWHGNIRTFDKIVQLRERYPDLFAVGYHLYDWLDDRELVSAAREVQ